MTARSMALTVWDRACYAVAYGAFLPTLDRVVRVLPTRVVRRLAERADRREAAAHYGDELQRVGLLRRYAVDRYDVRSDATGSYWRELRRRAGLPVYGAPMT